ncbi:hypothetical protein MHYP_G00071720 [Metynnis hypsauchen]
MATGSSGFHSSTAQRCLISLIRFPSFVKEVCSLAESGGVVQGCFEEEAAASARMNSQLESKRPYESPATPSRTPSSGDRLLTQLRWTCEWECFPKSTCPEVFIYAKLHLQDTRPTGHPTTRCCCCCEEM